MYEFPLVHYPCKIEFTENVREIIMRGLLALDASPPHTQGIVHRTRMVWGS